MSAESFVRGINYDPVHSVAFAHGMGTDDEGLMKEAIFTDLRNLQSLAKAQGMEIHHLKTFFSAYSSLHNKATLKVADVINQWNDEHPDYPFTLALGVYQFRPKVDACKTEAECRAWTQKQVDAAKESLEKYNANQIPLIDKIVVGNENLESFGMEARLISDMNQIKAQIQNLGIMGVGVGTAQIQNSVTEIYEGKPDQ